MATGTERDNVEQIGYPERMLARLPATAALVPSLLLTLLLVGCIGLDTIQKDAGNGHNLDNDSVLDSGSALDSVTDGNSAPIADAGDDITATTTRLVTLDGTGSSDPDDDPLTYSWELTTLPPSSSASLTSPTHPNASFVPDLEGRYVATLTVDDGALSDSDDVEITVTTVNGNPVANAGPDQAVAVGASVALDGTGSTDPEGDALAYVWTMTSRPGGSTAALAGANTTNPTFTADMSGSYTVSLTVSDGTHYSTPDTMNVSASSGSGSSSSSCGCQQAPDALGMSGVVGLLFGLPLLLRRRQRS